MTLAERRAAVRAALLADPCRSDRLIAAGLECNRELVARTRMALEAAPRDLAAGRYDSTSDTPGMPRRAAWAPRKGRDGKVYPMVNPRGRRKNRTTLLRERFVRLLKELRDPTVVAEFGRAATEQRDSIGRLSLEIAAAVARLRRADARRFA